jgi:hypothetical protein
MAKEPTSTMILIPGDKASAEATERHKRARNIVDLIFALDPATPARWRAIWRFWLTIKPITHYHEHLEAIHENKKIRASLHDPKFGQSAATLSKGGRDPSSGKQVQHLRLLGNMPESLHYWLKRLDPLGLGMATGTDNQKMRIKLYNEFSEYKIPEKL